MKIANNKFSEYVSINFLFQIKKINFLGQKFTIASKNEDYCISLTKLDIIGIPTSNLFQGIFENLWV